VARRCTATFTDGDTYVASLYTATAVLVAILALFATAPTITLPASRQQVDFGL